jgi:hypothetical protein
MAEFAESNNAACGYEGENEFEITDMCEIDKLE